MTAGAADLALGLGRPQYVASPDLLVVALAHEALKVSREESGAYVYKNERVRLGTRSVTTTYPDPNVGEVFDEWTRSLGAQGLATSATSEVLGRAVADSLVGVRPMRAKSSPAIPVTSSTALLQDVEGMLGTPGPPNFAKILGRLLDLGQPYEPMDLSDSWLAACARRLQGDPLLAAVDQAVVPLVPGLILPSPSDAPGGAAIPEWFLGPGRQTPMAWFARVWPKLMSDDWVAALPARRWLDWVATVLRLAIAFGYLWEARWFDQLATMVLEKDFDEARLTAAIESRARLMPWAAADEATSVRDVKHGSRALVIRGALAREFFALPEVTRLEGSPLEVLEAIAADPALVTLLEEKLRAKEEKRHTSTWETVWHALRTRTEDPDQADHYGLLRARGRRWSVVEPGTEWLAVVASLACPGPGTRTTAKAVYDDVTLLGLDPTLGDLLRLLEWAGVARSSADADHAVTVESAF